MLSALQDEVNTQTFDPYLPDWVPEGFSLLNMPGRELAGNLVLVTGEGDERRVLKLYRQRRGGRARRLFSQLSNWAFEGKRGESPSERRETERLSLELWSREGFDAFRVLELPAPDWIQGQPHLWLEYVPGQLLFDLFLDGSLPKERKLELVRRLGAAHQRRHTRALELGEPLLIQEHPTIKHTWLSEDDRLITMDLENGYRPDYPVLQAVGQELVGVIRSLWWFDEDEECFAPGAYPRAYVEAYDDPTLLRSSTLALTSGSLRWLMKRYGDRRRRARPKAAVATQLLTFLGDA